MPEEVFMVRMLASPEPGCDEFGTFGGAYVNCYVDADDLRTAEIRAISLIQLRGWQPQRFETWQLTCIDCADDVPANESAPSTRELVEQARVDGECCVFYTWPIDASDTDDPA